VKVAAVGAASKICSSEVVPIRESVSPCTEPEISAVVCSALFKKRCLQGCLVHQKRF
jgi:hypothetical protein